VAGGTSRPPPPPPASPPRYQRHPSSICLRALSLLRVLQPGIFSVVFPVAPVFFAARLARILYAQHAAPALKANTGTRVGPAWLPERDGSEAALDQEPEELPGGWGPQSGGGGGWGRRRRVSRRRRGDGDGGEHTESDRLQSGGSPMLQGEEIPGSYWEISQGTAATERGPSRRRDHRIRGEPPQPSRCQADRRAEENGGEHRDRVLRQPHR